MSQIAFPPEDEVRRIPRRQSSRLQAILFLTTGLATMAGILVATVNPLVAAGLLGPAAAGIPAAATLIGQASSSYGWGRLTHATGWRRGLTLGLALGGLGLLASTYGVVRGAQGAFLAGLVFAGAAFSVVLLSRFFAGEIVPPAERARAISVVVLGGTIGAVFGPLLVAPLGRWGAAALGQDLAGPYLGAAILLGLGACLVFAGLRPDPREVAFGRRRLEPGPARSPVSLRHVFARPGMWLGTLSMVVAQVVMVMLMVITSLHMRDHGHGLGGIAAAISAHTVGMYAFSAVSGRMADRRGRRSVILLGSAMLLAAALLAPVSPRLVPISGALFLLGFGWNLCFVGGSALFSDHVQPIERGQAQGVNDLLVNSASAVGSLASGLVFALAGFLAMAMLGAALALVPLVVVWRQRSARAGAFVRGSA
jgi:MFS family permease